jgi:protease I
MNKKALLIIASRDFRDEEYFVTKETLEKMGIKTKTASDEKGPAIGAFGGEAPVDILLNDADIDDFDAIVFIGGNGARKCLANENSYDLARKAIGSGKVLGAICIAPTILAEAGVLAGKRCTVWTSNMDKSAVKIIEGNGGKYCEQSPVIDGKIVTADNFESSQAFGSALARMLTESDK